MKKILFILFLFPTICFAQSYKEEKEFKKKMQAIADTTVFPQPFEYTRIDMVNLSKSKLFQKIHEWFATNMTNFSKAAQLNDSSSGKIIMADISSSEYQIHYTLAVDVKDNKYRIKAQDFYYQTTDRIDMKVPFYEVENKEMRGYIFSTKHDYWQLTKLNLRIEMFAIFDTIKKYILKEDSF